MFIDSHCHLDRVDLTPYQNDFERFMQQTRQSGVDHMLCVSIDLESYPQMLQSVEGRADVSVSIGVHPNEPDRRNPTIDELVEHAKHPQNVAIGETGLDYFRSEGDLSWQQERFRTHIRAAKRCNKPLIIHTRDAVEDTLTILKEEDAGQVGGVMHCFTEGWEMAEEALDMGFYISFSGILTFNSADKLREVARKVPEDRLLVETDCPYLAPVPHRGKSNEPRYVGLVGEFLARLRGVGVEKMAARTSDNFRTLFQPAAA